MKKIAHVLKKEPHVIFAYLYGSYTKGKQTTGSDIDVAVYLDNIVGEDPLYPSRLALKIENTLDKKISVDVRILNGSKLRFRHQVLKYGKLIHSKDEKTRIGFEAHSASRYMDFKPYLNSYNEARMGRLKA